MQRAGLLFDLGNGGIPLILIDDVQFNEVRLAPGIVNLRNDAIAALAVSAGDEDGGALSGDSRADARPIPP